MLLISLTGEIGGLERKFRAVKLLGTIETNLGARLKRSIYVYMLDGYVGG